VPATWGPVKAEMKIVRITWQNVHRVVRPVARGLPFVVTNLVLPRPDPKDVLLVLGGLLKRAAALPPPTDLMDEYEEHCLTLHQEFKRAEIPADCSLERYLSEWQRPETRKQQIRMAYAEFCDIFKQHVSTDVAKIGSFIKDEPYVDIKFPRWINARSDFAKSVLGGYAKEIYLSMARHPWVIKEVPVKERPRWLLDKFDETSHVFQTDFTSHESHFRTRLLRIELKFYLHILRAVPQLMTMLAFCDYISGHPHRIMDESYWNKMVMRSMMSVRLLATRMSGEVFTSSGNTFHNYAVITFVAKRKGCSVKGAVEGDDALFQTIPASIELTAQDFIEAGWNVKIVKHAHLNTASFCGNVFDTQDLTILRDPQEILASWGWAPRRYLGVGTKMLMSLLKSKSISYAYQYSQVPIVGLLARLILAEIDRQRPGLKVAQAPDERKQRILDEALATPLEPFQPGIRTRILAEQLYGITVESQLWVEQQLSHNFQLGGYVFPFATNRTWILEATKVTDDEYSKPYVTISHEVMEWMTECLSYTETSGRVQAQIFEMLRRRVDRGGKCPLLQDVRPTEHTV